MGDETRHADETHLSWKGTRKHHRHREDAAWTWIGIVAAVAFLGVVVGIVATRLLPL